MVEAQAVRGAFRVRWYNDAEQNAAWRDDKGSAVCCLPLPWYLTVVKIEQIIIRKLRALTERNDCLYGPSNTPFSGVCLRGPNGSGKTSYLEAIAELWQWFRRCTKQRGYAKPETELLQEAELVAVLLVDLPGPRPRMWLAYGDAAAHGPLPAGPENPYTLKGGRVLWNPEVLDYWAKAFEQAETGFSPETRPPNMVVIGAENKWVKPVRSRELLSRDSTPAFVVVPRYLPQARGQSHVEGMMRTLSLARQDKWTVLAKWVRELRSGALVLDGFEDDQRPRFRLRSGTRVTVDKLSAGERSLLINLCMILRWLSEGGIVLLDEPELHQHLSLMRGSLAVLHAMVEDDFQGQLIVASHAPEVWDHFRAAQAFIDLGAN